MSDNSNVTWLSDQLHSVLGHSDAAIAQYLTKLAETASTSEQLVGLLRKDMAVDNDMEALMTQLHQRTHSTGGGHMLLIIVLVYMY